MKTITLLLTLLSTLLITGCDSQPDEETRLLQFRNEWQSMDMIGYLNERKDFPWDNSWSGGKKATELGKLQDIRIKELEEKHQVRFEKTGLERKTSWVVLNGNLETDLDVERK